MKGGMDIPETTFAFIVFIGSIIFLVVLVSGLIEFGGEVKTPIKRLRAIEASHTVESCFIKLGGSNQMDNTIADYVLEHMNVIKKGLSKEGIPLTVESICGIDQPKIGAEIIDLEEGVKWEFPKSIKNPSHTIWVSIAYYEYYEPGDMINGKKLDDNMELNGEYVIETQYVEEPGLAGNDDVIMSIYSIDYLRKDKSKIQEMSITNIMREAFESKKDLTVRVKLNNKIGDLHPGNYQLEKMDYCGFSRMGRGTCLRLLKGVKKIHAGGLSVKI